MAGGSQNGCIVWRWTEETWSWNPSKGRWRPEYGAPKGVAHLEVSTEGIARKDRFDFWRETVFYNFEAQKAVCDENAGFSARALGLVSARGNFYVYQSDGVSGRRTRAQAENEEATDVELGVVIAGERHHIMDTDACHTARHGDLFVYDPGRPSKVHWTAHRGATLLLRRKVVENVIGGRLPPSLDLMRAVAATHLWPFLRGQLALLSRRAASMPAASQAVVLENTIDLALAALREAAFPAKSRGEAEMREGLFVAAKRYIETHLSDPYLKVDDVAQAIACSRATLYRIFAERGLTVAGYIRELRLRRFAALLEKAADSATISDLAERCGVLDPAVLRRLFRQRYGMTPQEALEHHRTRRAFAEAAGVDPAARLASIHVCSHGGSPITLPGS